MRTMASGSVVTASSGGTGGSTCLVDSAAASVAARLATGASHAVFDGFAPEELASSGRLALLGLWGEGKAACAEAGQGTEPEVQFEAGLVGGDKHGDGGGADSTLRSDQVAWVGGGEEGVAGTALADILAGLDALVLRGLAGSPGLEELAGRTLYRERVMLAVYPRGGHYGMHADNPGGRSNCRVLTAIVYLNDGWCPGDGGELRVHREYKTGSSVAGVVEPVGGRLVVFWSDSRTPHSVARSTGEQPRCALTCWYSEAGVM